MRPTQISAIILGNWNPKIFTPLWIKTQLFEIETREEIEIQLDFNDLELGFRYQNLFISPRQNLLDIKIDSIDKFFSNATTNEESFANVLIRIFNLLPQTPIKALGINVAYTFQANDKNVFVNPISDIKSPLKGFETNSVRRSAKKENYIINIISEKPSDHTVIVTINYHYHKIIKFEKAFMSQHINDAEKILNLSYEL
jgi:hypothetical protein